MIALLAGLAAFGVLWWMLRVYQDTDPARLAVLLRRLGGWLALGLAGLFALRGRLDFALLIGLGGISLLGLGQWSALKARSRGRTGRMSRIRSSMVEMDFDHDTGAMDGVVLEGEYQGRPLSDLDLPELLLIRVAALERDPEAVRLLDAYLDRRFAFWRKDAEGNDNAGTPHVADTGPITEQEAYQILGLEPGATERTIRRAHRSLMKRFHPDQGGSVWLAARLNQARDILLRRHR